MLRIIVVDDEPRQRKGLVEIICRLRPEDEVIAMKDGEQVLEYVHDNEVDIIFSDIRMPQMSGLELSNRLLEVDSEIIMILISVYADFEYAREAIRLGVTRFLLKPSKIEELEEAVSVMVQNLSHMKERTEDGKAVQEEPEETAAGSFIAQNAVKYIEENYMEKLKLSDVADHVYVSQWHLSKILNQHVEKSFSDILNQTRIEKAKELLWEPSLRIGDIAEKVGFLDMAHFSRVFKKFTGLSANEFRNQMKSEKGQP